MELLAVIFWRTLPEYFFGMGSHNKCNKTNKLHIFLKLPTMLFFFNNHIFFWSFLWLIFLRDEKPSQFGSAPNAFYCQINGRWLGVHTTSYWASRQDIFLSRVSFPSPIVKQEILSSIFFLFMELWKGVGQLKDLPCWKRHRPHCFELVNLLWLCTKLFILHVVKTVGD